VCGVAGVEVGTEKVWEMLEDLRLPRMIVVNKLDRENASFSRTVAEIQQFFGRQAIPVQIPIGEEKNFSGVIDLIKKKAFLFEKDESGKFQEIEIPPELKNEVEKRSIQLVEIVAESDEKLMEKYFDQGELPTDELLKGLKKSVLEHQIFPIFAASALQNIGAQLLLDGIVDFMPSPADRGKVRAKIKGLEQDLALTAEGPFSALVFKTISDPYTGRISLLRVFSGKIGPEATITNTTKDTDEKLGGLFFLQGKEQIPAGQAKAGDIVATAKLKATLTGDTLCTKGAEIEFEPIKFPEPSISFAIEPKTRADEDKISQATHRVTEEDPTVRIERDPETNQLLISGNGELHVRIITEKLKKRYNVDVELKPPKIPY
ncbi:MAG: GTP-binding protein, partial [Candidatus Saccharicenans sp.]